MHYEGRPRRAFRRSTDVSGGLSADYVRMRPSQSHLRRTLTALVVLAARLVTNPTAGRAAARTSSEPVQWGNPGEGGAG
jgi:hypothetical protein